MVHVQGEGLLTAARASFPNEAQARAFVRLLSAEAEWLILHQKNQPGSGLGTYEPIEESAGWKAYLDAKAAAVEDTIVKA